MDSINRENIVNSEQFPKEIMTIIENSNIGYYVTTEKGDIIDCNDATANLLGFPRAHDLIGRNVKDFFESSDHGREWKNLKESGGLINRELTLKDKHGNSKPMYDNCRLIKSQENNEHLAIGLLTSRL